MTRRTISLSKPPTVTAGDPVSASTFNAARASIRNLLDEYRRQLPTPVRPWSETMEHQITGIQGDYLECVRVWRGETLGSEQVNVAKPRLLRQSVTARDGVTYVYTDSQTRTASKSGETDELQRVTPTYLVGDRIEVEIVRGLTLITEVDEQRGRPVDKNLDGRSWAAEPPSS